MEEVPRRISLVPLAFPCFLHCLMGVETEGRLDYQGRAGIISTVRWHLRPIIFGVETALFPRGYTTFRAGVRRGLAPKGKKKELPKIGQ